MSMFNDPSPIKATLNKAGTLNITTISSKKSSEKDQISSLNL
jgi:hypothetical protein